MTDLLVDAGRPIPPIDTEETPSEPVRGVCRVCGQPAATAKSTYCPDHQNAGRRPAAPVGETTAVLSPAPTPSAPARKRSQGTGKGAPSAEEWSSKVFDKSIILITALVASSAVRRYAINDPDEAIADTLTATDDEARRIAKPFSRYMAGTGFNKRAGRKILDNSDLLDAGFALYDWYDRVNKTLKTFAGQTHLASVTNIRPEGTPHEPTVETPGHTGTGGDFPDFGPQPFPL